MRFTIVVAALFSALAIAAPIGSYDIGKQPMPKVVEGSDDVGKYTAAAQSAAASKDSAAQGSSTSSKDSSSSEGSSASKNTSDSSSSACGLISCASSSGAAGPNGSSSSAASSGGISPSIGSINAQPNIDPEIDT